MTSTNTWKSKITFRQVGCPSNCYLKERCWSTQLWCWMWNRSVGHIPSYNYQAGKELSLKLKKFIDDSFAIPKRSAFDGAFTISLQNNDPMTFESSIIPMVIDNNGRGERVYDIYSLLLKERIVFLGSKVDDRLANVIVAQLLYLNSIDPKLPINLYINSPGGSVYAGLAIYDAMQMIQAPVSTVAVGVTASMGTALLTSVQKVHDMHCLTYNSYSPHWRSAGLPRCILLQEQERFKFNFFIWWANIVFIRKKRGVIFSRSLLKQWIKGFGRVDESWDTWLHHWMKTRCAVDLWNALKPSQPCW